MPQCTQLSGVLKQTEPVVKPEKNPRGMPYFTGEVAIDSLHAHQPAKDIQADYPASINTVTFTSGARTNWHWHERGQLLTVIKGNGWICDKGEKPKPLREGDIIWCPPGVTHWHGADDAADMMHIAFSMGAVEWYDAVSDAEYEAKG